jgi:AraC-like DNA-binding protein/mannose-6-phosphate isomerase-like protein (cupin superfamily)
MHMKNIEYRCMRGSGLELILCRERPMIYPWHFHSRHWTFGLVRSGFAVVTTQQGTFRLTAGQTFVFAPFAPHQIHIAGQSSVAVLCSEASDVSLDTKIRRLAGFHNTNFSALDMQAWLSAPAENSNVCIHPLQSKDASPVAATQQLLTDQADEHFPLKRLARYAGCSPWHFLRSFKKETGFTPHAFQIICRLGLARHLLRTGTAAAEAAVSAGFTDQSHMHKLFKLHHGLTPKQFVEAGFILEH